MRKPEISVRSYEVFSKMMSEEATVFPIVEDFLRCPINDFDYHDVRRVCVASAKYGLYDRTICDVGVETNDGYKMVEIVHGVDHTDPMMKVFWKFPWQLMDEVDADFDREDMSNLHILFLEDKMDYNPRDPAIKVLEPMMGAEAGDKKAPKVTIINCHRFAEFISQYPYLGCLCALLSRLCAYEYPFYDILVDKAVDILSAMSLENN